MSSKKQRRSYDKEFEREAVRLVVEERRSAAEVERNLGIGNGIVRRWARELEAEPVDAFPGKGQLRPGNADLRALKRELEKVTRERDILKKLWPSSGNTMQTKPVSAKAPGDAYGGNEISMEIQRLI